MQGKIVSAVYYEGTVLIFTEFGYVYEMYKSANGIFQFRLIHRMLEQ